jgi:hypothetical protein
MRTLNNQNVPTQEDFALPPKTTNILTSPFTAFAASVIAASLWIWALVALPEFQRSGLSLILPRVVVHLLLLGGAWVGLNRTSLKASTRMWTWIAIAVPLTLWHAVAWLIVSEGLLRTSTIRLPLLPLLIIGMPVIINAVVLRSRRIGTLLDAIPTTWLVGIQFYRVIGASFLVNWLAGRVPGAFAIPAGTGDTITGLLALPVAASLASGRFGSMRWAVLWNIFGIGDLILAIILGALTSPGPLQHLALNQPNLLIGTYPFGIIPLFAVPSSLVLHAMSLRQLRRRTRPENSFNHIENT